tara:strand:+ start:597 stop:1343 length:747 start_codon:yes stop_codon:yes gene_type:complete
MKKLLIIYLLFSIILSQEITGLELAEQINNNLQPKDSKSMISMDLVNIKRNKTRKSEMISISKDDGDKMLLFFKSPKRDKGIGFLKIENDDSDKFALFIPKLKKIRRISSDNQSDSFMNSDLSYEDMLSRNLDDFNYSIISSDDNFYVLKSIPKDDNSEYSKHESWVSKDKLLIEKENSYDKKGNLLKEKLFVHEHIKNYEIVSEINVTNVQKQHQTILKIKNLGIDMGIEDNIFQEKNLKRFEKFLE